MANALHLAGTGLVNAGRAAAVDNVPSHTHVVLYRGGSVGPANVLATKRNNGGGASGWSIGVNGAPNRYVSGKEYVTTSMGYSTAFDTLLNAPLAWYWLCCVQDIAGAGGAQSTYYASPFGAPLTTIARNGTNVDGSGSVVDDSANNIVIGGTPALEPALAAAVAFVGQINAALTLSQAQAVVEAMAAVPWAFALRLGWDGAGTAPDFAGTLSPSVVGPTALIDTAPEYWTGAGGGAVDPANTSKLTIPLG
jgi:hypothetical protein